MEDISLEIKRLVYSMLGPYDTLSEETSHNLQLQILEQIIEKKRKT